MPISFRCSRCQSTIRVPDGSEGKKTKCPNCQEVQRIPDQTSSAPASTPTPSGDLGSSGGESDALWASLDNDTQSPSTDSSTSPNPFGDGPDPFGVPGQNPYSSPGTSAHYGQNPISRDSARNKLMLPVICVVVSMILGILFHSLNLLVQTLNMAAVMKANNIRTDDARAFYLIGLYVFNPLVILLSLVTIAAMTRAIAVRNYGFVLTGFIMGMIPCTSGCGCIPAMVFCIWGIVVLSSPPVSAAFRSP